MTSATIHTNQGDIIVELFTDHAPKAVHNFVELATGAREYTDKNAKGTLSGPFYDGSIFHRIIDGFMIQGGDPTGTGMGGPGYKFNGEKNVDETYNFNRPFILAMANSGPSSDGSQFFITVGAHKHLNGGYSIFGEVTDPASQAVVTAISKVPTARGDRPKSDVVITSITVDTPA